MNKDIFNLTARLTMYSGNMFVSSSQIRPLIEQQWKSGIFTIIPLNIRFVFELWGTIHYALMILKRLIKEKDIECELKKINRLILGTRAIETPPWGKLGNDISINVMDFICYLNKDDSESEELYSFLCEGAHPNLLQSSYYFMAGPPASNWDNVPFKDHAHQLLDKTLEHMRNP